MNLDSSIWGPHYWFFLHSISFTYPLHPTSVVKKKYYDFVHSIPLFLPSIEMGTVFSKLLVEYPVTPYLQSRKSFVSWMHFIHNKINVLLEKPKYPIAKLYLSMQQPPPSQQHKRYVWLKFGILLVSILGIAFYLYNK